MRRAAKLVMTVALASVTVAGCSGGGSSQPSSGSRSSAHATTTVAQTPNISLSKKAPAEADVRPKGATPHVDSRWQLPRYTAQWPSFEGAPALSSALAQQASKWTSEYTTTYDKATYADLSVTWQPLADGAYRGVRLTANTLGADASTESVVKYGNASKVYTSLDLIDPTQRDVLKTALVEQVAKFTGEKDVGADADAFTDISFGSNGDMQIRISEGALASASQGVLYATVKNPRAFLSPMGQQIRTSVTTSARTTKPHLPADDTAINCKVHKCIALTFDDGPGPYTNSILEALRDKKARATFFMLGPAVEAQPDVVRRMHSLGMELGNHSWSHPQFTLLGPGQVAHEFSRQAAAVKEATGDEPDVARPPYGAFDQQTPHDGYPFVLWDVDTEDWKNRDAAITTQRALDGAHPGAIILMHDIHPSTAKAVPGIIDALQKQGYTLVTVHDLVGVMSKNKAYYSATDAR